MIWVPLAIGAGLGAIKGMADKEKAERQRELEAKTAQYSPWTGLNPRPVQEADMVGSVMQGGLTGAMLGQALDGGAAQALTVKQALSQVGASAPTMYSGGPAYNPYKLLG